MILYFTNSGLLWLLFLGGCGDSVIHLQSISHLLKFNHYESESKQMNIESIELDGKSISFHSQQFQPEKTLKSEHEIELFLVA